MRMEWGSATTGLAASRGVKRQEADLASWRPKHLIARIDRDLSVEERTRLVAGKHILQLRQRGQLFA